MIISFSFILFLFFFGASAIGHDVGAKDYSTIGFSICATIVALLLFVAFFAHYAPVGRCETCNRFVYTDKAAYCPNCGNAYLWYTEVNKNETD